MPADKSTTAASTGAGSVGPASSDADLAAVTASDADADLDATDGSDGADAGAETDDVPMNRAERRAKKKAGGKPQVVTKMQPRGVNNAPGPRQWANRRSG